MEDILIIALISLAIAAALGVIPAYIAQNKGYSFGLWWVFGWLLFIVALICSFIIPDKNVQQTPTYSNSSPDPTPNAGKRAEEGFQQYVDELKKYKELLDQGVITEQEFQAKKEQILKQM